MPTLQQIGSFELTSPTVVVTDPGYDEARARIGGLGCIVPNCHVGNWRVELAPERTTERPWDMPRILTAIHDELPTPPYNASWKRIGHVGGDGGVLGIYDFAHFHNHGLVRESQRWTFDGGPVVPDDLWYSLNCEAIKGRLAAVIPHGVVVRWDGGMDVDSLVSGGRVAAVRLSISGWPDAV